MHGRACARGCPRPGNLRDRPASLSPSRTLLHIRERVMRRNGRERALVWAGVAAESCPP